MHPDFSRFFALKTLPSKDFPLGMCFLGSEAQLVLERCADDSDRRVIILGDVHGNDKPLQYVNLFYSPM